MSLNAGRFAIEILPSALSELNELPSARQKALALELLMDLAYGRNVPGEELTQIPAFRRRRDFRELAGVYRVLWDVPERHDKGPRFQMVYRFLPPLGDSRQPRVQILVVGRLPSSAAEVREAAAETTARLRKPFHAALEGNRAQAPPADAARGDRPADPRPSRSAAASAASPSPRARAARARSTTGGPVAARGDSTGGRREPPGQGREARASNETVRRSPAL